MFLASLSFISASLSLFALATFGCAWVCGWGLLLVVLLLLLLVVGWGFGWGFGWAWAFPKYFSKYLLPLVAPPWINDANALFDLKFKSVVVIKFPFESVVVLASLNAIKALSNEGHAGFKIDPAFRVKSLSLL